MLRATPVTGAVNVLPPTPTIRIVVPSAPENRPCLSFWTSLRTLAPVGGTPETSATTSTPWRAKSGAAMTTALTRRSPTQTRVWK